MNLDKLSQEVYLNKLQIENPNLEAHEVGFDPTTIALIFSVVKGVVGCIRDRRASKEEVVFLVRNPSKRDIIRLRKIIRGILGFWRFRREGKSILESILRTGGSLNLDDIADLLVQRELL